MSVRAVVLTFNEATFIEGCLASLASLTDDVVVIDSGSTDQTREVAAELGARVVCRPWSGFAAQRQVALEKCADRDWTLFLDADERLTPALRDEIVEALKGAGPDIAGFLIPRRNVICGRVMRGGGWWPDYQPRLLRPGRCRYDALTGVHEVPICNGLLLALNHPLIHLNYLSWIQFGRRQLRYARLGAGAGARPRRRRYVGAPVREFARRFVEQRGYLDGATGVVACALVALASVYATWCARRAPAA
jgi:glycosyltransferase involved in cell wall biosynthesis